MGTEITLELGGLTLDWSKNERGEDHGALFQNCDRKRTRSDQLDYDYFAEKGDDPGEMEMAFVRCLREVMPRLELLGFTLERAGREYVGCAKACREERKALAEEDDEEVRVDVMEFDEFCDFVTAYPVQSLDNTFQTSLEPRDVRGRFNDDTRLQRLPSPRFEASAYSERSYFGGIINVLHPYSVLRVLAEGPDNLDTDVVWQYGPLVNNGWASASEFEPSARRTQAFLIATEGSSDAHILQHGFNLLRPEIKDFFRFIDMSEGHPFPGTGNLVKFANGLVKIDVHNQIVFLLDNDAEGLDAYRRIMPLVLPSNMRAIMLPDLEAFRQFPARGPEGEHLADINQRAAAIECYLDLSLPNVPPPRVVWTNFKSELDAYHGALEYKESYTKHFLKQTLETIANGYDTVRIEAVLDAVVAECTTIAETLACEVK